MVLSGRGFPRRGGPGIVTVTVTMNLNFDRTIKSLPVLRVCQ